MTGLLARRETSGSGLTGRGRARRLGVVLGLLTVLLAVAGVAATPASASISYGVTATINVGGSPTRWQWTRSPTPSM